MKVIAKTKTPIMLMDPNTQDLLEETPAVVTWSHFFEARTGRGQIKVLSEELPAEATNQEFQLFLADSDTEEQAIAAFISKFQTPTQSTASKKSPAKKKASD